MTHHDQKLSQKLKSIKSDLLACLTSSKFGLTTNELLKDYKDVTGESIFPNLEFGFKKPNKFLKSECFSDTMRFESGKWHVIANEKTKHIRDFVEGQRSNINTSKSNTTVTAMASSSLSSNKKGQNQKTSTNNNKKSDHFDIDECDEIFKDLKIKHDKDEKIVKSVPSARPILNRLANIISNR